MSSKKGNKKTEKEKTNIKAENKKKVEDEKPAKFLINKNLLLTLLSSFTFAFTIFFYIPYETLAQNTISLGFSISSVIVYLIISGLVAFVVSFFILLFVKGKAWTILVTLFMGLGFCSYVQATFLNGNLGSLTGDEIDWSSMTGSMILNIVIWIAIFAAVYVVLFVFPKVWKSAVCIICAITLVMQVAGFAGNLFSNNKEKSFSSYELTYDNLTTFSKNDNIFVFCLDRLDYDYIEMVAQDTPGFFDKLDGFTSYTDATSTFFRTLTGANYLLTGYSDTAYDEPLADFLDHSWEANNKHILKYMNNSGYKVDLYEETNIFFGDSSLHASEVDNLKDVNANINIGKFYSNMASLLMYRIVPTVLKSAFWEGATYFTSGIVETADTDIYDTDETRFKKELDSINLENINYLKFYHFFGSHAPYTLDQNGDRTETETDVVTQTKGDFNILYKAFDKMKELGIYENATIIITGDHGKVNWDSKPLDGAERIGMFYKPAGSANTPLAYSDEPVGQINVPATIVKATGGDYSQYGIPLDEVTKDNTKVRYAIKSIMDKGTGKEVEKLTYEITGTAADWNHWKIIDDVPAQYSYN